MSHGVQPRQADPSALLMKSALRGGLGLLRSCADAFRSALPDRDAAADLRELQNKLEVFERFQYALAEVGASAAAPLSLPEAVRRTAALEPWTRLWIVEGVGHACAEAAWSGPAPPRGLLTSPAGIPAESWIPLHTGMGLAFASRALRDRSAAEIPAALRLLLGLCERCSAPGYAGAAFEGLGFVARNLYSSTVPEIDRQLARLAPGLRGGFWHGVGRGLYFSPAGFLPGSTGAAMTRAAGEPPHEEGRLNALSGAAWALTLVNLRHPEVLASFLDRHPRLCLPPEGSALADGISSAAAVWSDTAGSGGWLNAFLGYRPAGDRAAGLWRRLVEEPCRNAVRRCAGLRRSRRLEDLFRYSQGGPP